MKSKVIRISSDTPLEVIQKAISAYSLPVVNHKQHELDPFRTISERLIENNNLNEGLIRSIPRNQIRSLVKQKYPDIKISVSKKIGKEFFSIRISGKVDSSFESFLKISGWYIARSNLEIEHFIEPIYDTELEISELPEFIFHVAPTYLLPKIQKIGLIPKSKSRIGEHPERIYFSISEEGSIDISLALSYMNKFPTGVDKFMTTLKISTKLLHRQSPGIRFFVDPNYTSSDGKSIMGIYTLSNIPPGTIQF